MNDHEHVESLESIGYGFGQLDYFCRVCQKRIRSVPFADLNSDEQRAVGNIVGTLLGGSDGHPSVMSGPPNA